MASSTLNSARPAPTIPGGTSVAAANADALAASQASAYPKPSLCLSSQDYQRSEPIRAHLQLMARGDARCLCLTLQNVTTNGLGLAPGMASRLVALHRAWHPALLRMLCVHYGYMPYAARCHVWRRAMAQDTAVTGTEPHTGQDGLT